jgi:hypothetical protein
MHFMRGKAGILILGISLLDSWLGWLCARAARDTYSFMIPFVVAIVTCSLVGVVAVGMNTRATRLLQNGLVVLSSVPYLLIKWPGDDDGAGMIMGVLVGPTLLAAVAMAFFSTVRILEE